MQYLLAVVYKLPVHVAANGGILRRVVLLALLPLRTQLLTNPTDTLGIGGAYPKLKQ